MIDSLIGENIRSVEVTLTPEKALGYVKMKSDNNQTGFLVFHYGAKVNLRKSPTSEL